MQISKPTAASRKIANSWFAAGVVLQLLVVAESLSLDQIGCGLTVANYVSFGTLPILVSAFARNQHNSEDSKDERETVTTKGVQTVALLAAIAAMVAGLLVVPIALASHILGMGGVVVFVLGAALGLLIFVAPKAT